MLHIYITADQTPDIPIYVTRSETIRNVLKRMCDGNVHRIFVCEVDIDSETGNRTPCVPISVITQRDIIHIIATLITDNQLFKQIMDAKQRDSQKTTVYEEHKAGSDMLELEMGMLNTILTL